MTDMKVVPDDKVGYDFIIFLWSKSTKLVSERRLGSIRIRFVSERCLAFKCIWARVRSCLGLCAIASRPACIKRYRN